MFDITKMYDTLSRAARQNGLSLPESLMVEAPEPPKDPDALEKFLALPYGGAQIQVGLDRVHDELFEQVRALDPHQVLLGISRIETDSTLRSLVHLAGQIGLFKFERSELSLLEGCDARVVAFFIARTRQTDGGRVERRFTDHPSALSFEAPEASPESPERVSFADALAIGGVHGNIAPLLAVLGQLLGDEGRSFSDPEALESLKTLEGADFSSNLGYRVLSPEQVESLLATGQRHHFILAAHLGVIPPQLAVKPVRTFKPSERLFAALMARRTQESADLDSATFDPVMVAATERVSGPELREAFALLRGHFTAWLALDRLLKANALTPEGAATVLVEDHAPTKLLMELLGVYHPDAGRDGVVRYALSRLSYDPDHYRELISVVPPVTLPLVMSSLKGGGTLVHDLIGQASQGNLRSEFILKNLMPVVVETLADDERLWRKLVEASGSTPYADKKLTLEEATKVYLKRWEEAAKRTSN